MLKWTAAKLIRLLSSEEDPTVDHQEVKEKKDVLIQTSVKPTDVSIYYPMNTTVEKLPVYMNLHGGAFIMNSKEMDDVYCRRIANHTGCAVVNVDYGKAPEYSFPQPIQQCYEVLQWIRAHSEELGFAPEKIMIGGQSSGANIAAALCLFLKERNEPQPLLQVLCCPMLDFVTPHADKPEPDPRRAKYPQVANFMNRCYVPNADLEKHPHASPVLAENVEGLASALFIIAEYDAFHPEGKAYAEKLEQADVPVRKHVFKDCYHAFTHKGPKDKAEEAWALIEEAIKETVSQKQLHVSH